MESAFWVLEGMDGCGKSTQAAALVEGLRAEGRETLHLREPGSTRLGEKLRDLLLEGGREDWNPRTEALLFYAARRQLLEEVIGPALQRGCDVVCERFSPSTLAYQGQDTGMREWVLQLDRMMVEEERQPTCVFILDLDADQSFARVQQDRDPQADSFEGRGLSFQQKVRQGYLAYANAFPSRSQVVRVDGRSIEDIAEEILQQCQDRRP